jgi:hypothetical protein
MQGQYRKLEVLDEHQLDRLTRAEELTFPAHISMAA